MDEAIRQIGFTAGREALVAMIAHLPSKAHEPNLAEVITLMNDLPAALKPPVPDFIREEYMELFWSSFTAGAQQVIDAMNAVVDKHPQVNCEAVVAILLVMHPV